MNVTCRHCGRHIVKEGEYWIDPEAPATPDDGDDYIWRETCDANDEDIFAYHEPVARTWHAAFYGREVGAIGVFARFNITVEADDEEAANLALYETHEHISGLTLTEVNP